MQHYKSAVDWWLAVILAACPLYCIVMGLYFLAVAPEAALYSILAGLLVAGITILFLPCRYTLEEDHLFIRSGIYKQRIPYRSIKDVSFTSSPLSAPAFSLKRLRIEHDRGTVLISPAKREAFIEALKAKL